MRRAIATVFPCVLLLPLMLSGCSRKDAKPAAGGDAKRKEKRAATTSTPEARKDGAKATAPVQPASPATKVEVVDPPEKEPPEWLEGKRGMDVQRVLLETDGTHLHVTVCLDRGFKTYLDEYKWGLAAVEVFLDTDDNEKTGGKTFSGSRPGFEYKLKPLSGVTVEVPAGTGKATMKLFEGGSSKAAQVTGYLASYSLSRYLPGKWPDEETLVQGQTEGPQKTSSIEGKQLTVKIPYEKMGLKPGQTIRVAIQEKHAKEKYCVDMYLPDTRLRVK